MPFIAAVMFFVATNFKSVGVASGASRLRARSWAFFGVSVVVIRSSRAVEELSWRSDLDAIWAPAAW
jgi:hypothetical protein